METKSKLSKFFIENADAATSSRILKLFYHVDNIMATCDMYEHLRRRKVFEWNSSHFLYLSNHIARSLACVRNDGFSIGEDLPSSHRRSELLVHLRSARIKYLEYLESVTEYRQINCEQFLQMNLRILGVVAILHCCKFVIDDQLENEEEYQTCTRCLCIPIQTRTELGILLDYCRFLILHSGLSPKDLMKLIKLDIQPRISEYLMNRNKQCEDKEMGFATIQVLHSELARSNEDLMNPSALFESLLLCYEAGTFGVDDKDIFKILISLLDRLYGRTSHPITLMRKPFLTKQGLKYLFDYMGQEKLRANTVFYEVNESTYVDYVKEYILYDINERVWSIAIVYKDYWRRFASKGSSSAPEKLKFLKQEELRFVKDILEDMKTCLCSLLPEKYRHKVDTALAKKLDHIKELLNLSRYYHPREGKLQCRSDFAEVSRKRSFINQAI